MPDNIIYLEAFSLPSEVDENSFFDRPIGKNRRTCYTNRYPFRVFRCRQLPEFRFAPLTILYGGNGSGKTTILNLIAESLHLQRSAVFNRSDFYEDYLAMCRYRLASGKSISKTSRIITSDDVFDYLLDIRNINDGVDKKRGELFDQYHRERFEPYQFKGLDDYHEFCRRSDAKSCSQSEYVRRQLRENIPERSNGESALRYFTESIHENALYLLDEPENSLSAARQLALKQFIEDSVRFYGCQFIIETHSPFLLSMHGACIYDLDAEPVQTKAWTELDNVRQYYEFFQQHGDEFAD